MGRRARHNSRVTLTSPSLPANWVRSPDGLYRNPVTKGLSPYRPVLDAPEAPTKAAPFRDDEDGRWYSEGKELVQEEGKSGRWFHNFNESDEQEYVYKPSKNTEWKEGRWVPGNRCPATGMVTFCNVDRRLAATESSDPSALQSILAAFLLLIMMVVYLFSRRFTVRRKISNGFRIVRKKQPTRIIFD